MKLQSTETSVETDRDYLLNLVSGVAEERLTTHHAEPFHASYNALNAQVCACVPARFLCACALVRLCACYPVCL